MEYYANTKRNTFSANDQLVQGDIEIGNPDQPKKKYLNDESI
jgi:hypothetical protein